MGRRGHWPESRPPRVTWDPAVPERRRVTSAQRATVKAMLRHAQRSWDDVTLIAVVDAAARWMDEPDGDQYAWALLGVLVDGPTQLRAYGELLGTGGGVG